MANAVTTLTTAQPILLTDATKAVLERGKYSKDRTNVPNTHPALKNDIEGIKATAEALGIDFEKTKFTFTVSKTSNGVNVYSPYVGQDKGEAVIYWGETKHPLSSVGIPKSIDELGKRVVMTFEVVDDFFSLSLMLPKENKADLITLRKALKQGKLGEYLAQSFPKPKSLSELKPGEYTVVGYDVKDFNGDLKYTIFIDGLGAFNANTKLRRKLASTPDISANSPAMLLVGEITETTSTGYPIVPVDLTTVEDLDIPVYDF